MKQGRWRTSLGDFLMLMALISALIGILPLLRGDYSFGLVLELLAVILAVIAWRLGEQPADGGEPHADTDRPFKSSSDDMENTLRQLGIPLDFSVSDAETAFTGGLVKASIFHGYKSLTAGKLDEA